jgi:sphingomyelin phosphodiesterase acid-like 3
MWKPVYTEAFQNLLTRYHNMVTISLAGHEHTDDFRLVGNSLVLMTPGLSPNVGQNPAFRTVDFWADGTISDETTFYLSNLNVIANGGTAEWKREYSFAETWGLHRLDFQNIRKLYHEIETKPDVHDRWSSLYSVSRPEGNTITKQTFPGFSVQAGTRGTRNTTRALDRLKENHRSGYEDPQTGCAT